MNIRHAAIIGSLALILGFALGYLVGGERGEPVQGQAPDSGQLSSKATGDSFSTDSGEQPSRPEPKPREITPPKTGESRTTTTDSAPVLPDPAANLMQAVQLFLGPEPDKPTGPGEFSGRVVEEETGKPMAGVLVVAKADVSMFDDDYLENLLFGQASGPGIASSGIDKAMAVAIKQVQLAKVYTFTTRTGEDGSYRLTGLLQMTYNLVPESEGWSFWPRDYVSGGDFSNWSLRPSAEIIFEASKVEATLSVLVTVLGLDGSVCPVGEVCKFQCPPDYEGTDANAAFEALYTGYLSYQNHGGKCSVNVSPGIWLLWARQSDEEGGLFSDPLLVTVDKGPPAPVTLTLKTGTAVTVDLSQDPMTPGSDEIRLVCAPWSHAQALTVENLETAQFGAWSNVWRDSNWEEGDGFGSNGGHKAIHLGFPKDHHAIIRFRYLAPGEYQVAAIVNSRILAHQIVFVEQDKDAKISLSIPPTPRSEYAIVWVKDPDGQTLTKDVSLTYARRTEENDSYSTSYGHVYRPQRDGSIAVASPPAESGESGLLPPTCFVIAHHPRYGYKKHEFVPGPADVLEIQFDLPATLLLKLNGIPSIDFARSLRISYEPPGSDAGFNYDVKLNFADCTATLEHMQAGRVTVEVDVAYTRESDYTLVTTALTVRSGQQTHQIDLPAFFPLSVTLPDVGAGKEVTVWWASDRNGPRDPANNDYEIARGKTDINGTVQFPHLPGGVHLVHVIDSEGSYSVTEVSLPGASSITISPMR